MEIKNHCCYFSWIFTLINKEKAMQPPWLPGLWLFPCGTILCRKLLRVWQSLHTAYSFGQNSSFPFAVLSQHHQSAPLLPPVMRPLFEKAKRKFDEIKIVAGDFWNPYNLVFYDEFGNPINPNRISTRFHEFIKKHRLSYMRYHDLRHFNLSLLLANNVPLPRITAHSGYARASTLLDVYGHAMDQNKQQIPEIIGSDHGGFVADNTLYPFTTK